MTYDFRVRTASSKKPLYGHDSPQNAYVIDDYPSGFKARCRKRVWLEFKARQGFRLVEQTSKAWYPGGEPEKDAALSWNKPKASTYAGVAGCMYLDAQDHVQWAGLTGYSNASAVSEFMKEFPKADFDGIKALVFAQTKHLVAQLKGATWVINGEPKPASMHELGEARKELETWSAIGKEVGLKAAPLVQDLIDGKVAPTVVDPEEMKAKMKVEQEEAEAAKAEEVKKTPGAMSFNKFADWLESKVKVKGGAEFTIDRSEHQLGGSGALYCKLFIKDKGRLQFTIAGFDRKDRDQAVVKVKVEQFTNFFGGDRAKTLLRAKSGTPAKIAEYLAAHLNKVLSEAGEEKTASSALFDYSF